MGLTLLEEPVTNDGLFVKTRSGKGGVDDSVTELGDVGASLKRNAQMAFEELQREEEKSLDTIRKKQRLVYVGSFYAIHGVGI